MLGGPSEFTWLQNHMRHPHTKNLAEVRYHGVHEKAVAIHNLKRSVGKRHCVIESEADFTSRKQTWQAWSDRLYKIATCL